MEFVILHATATSVRAHNLNGHFRKELEIIIFPTRLSLPCMLIGLCDAYMFSHTERELRCSTELPLVQAI